MGTAAIIIEQTIEGQTFETVHGAQGELDLIGEDGLPSEAAILEFFAGNLPDAAFEDATDPGGADPTPQDYGLVGSLIYFHRYLQAEIVRLTRLYITDGRKNTEGTGNVFYSLPLDIPCRGVGMNASELRVNVAPSNQAFLIDKVPKGFGKRAGRIFLRGAMESTDLVVGGINGVEINPARVPFYTTRLASAAVFSGLSNWFDTGTDGDQASVYAILNYRTKAEYDVNPELEGQVKGSTGVIDLRYGGATGRQTNRPSKRK